MRDDAIKWKHFPHYWSFVQGIPRSLGNSPHKGQWCGALMFSLICACINGWVYNPEAGDLRCHHAHYGVTVMEFLVPVWIHCYWASFSHIKWTALSPGCPMWDTQTSRWQSWRKLIHNTLEIALNIYELIVNPILCGAVWTDKNSKAHCSSVGGLLIRVIVFLMRLIIKEPWYLARSCPTMWIMPSCQLQHIGNYQWLW